MTNSFYVPPSGFRGNEVTFPDDEARHAVSVLRHAVGDVVRVVDGEGRAVLVRLTRADRNGAAGTVEREDNQVREAALRVTLGIGLLKQRARFETLLEKATELGVQEIVPIQSERTERERLRLDRAESILISAMKQSHRSYRPRLLAPMDVGAFVEQSAFDARFVCHEAAGGSNDGLVHIESQGKVAVLVGPEGGFTEEEVLLALNAGFHALNLGPRRLRAETAAMAVLSALFLGAEASPILRIIHPQSTT